MRNGSTTKTILNLPIQSDVRVWRKKDEWTGLFKLLATNGETYIIDMPYGPTSFRLTVIKSYYFLSEVPQEEKDENKDEFFDQSPPSENDNNTIEQLDNETRPIIEIQIVKRSRGRLKELKNKIYYVEDDDIDMPISFITGKE